MAFSIGIFIGFSPLLGLHTVMGVAVAYLFRLNKIAVMIGVWSNVPWLLIPFYSFATWVGVKLMGLPEGITLPEIGLSDFMRPEFWAWLRAQWRLLIPMFFGSLLISSILALLAYPAAFLVVKNQRAKV